MVKLKTIHMEITRVEDRPKAPVFDVLLSVTFDGYSSGFHHEVDNLADALDLINDRIVDAILRRA